MNTPKYLLATTALCAITYGTTTAATIAAEPLMSPAYSKTHPYYGQMRRKISH
jgi:hypothetical protein